MIETNRIDRQNGVRSASTSVTTRRRAYERYVTRYTAREDGTVSLSELATAIVSRQGNETDAGDRSERLDSVRIRLYHHHVPRLSDAGVVDWYREDGEIYVERTADA